MISNFKKKYVKWIVPHIFSSADNNQNRSIKFTDFFFTTCLCVNVTLSCFKQWSSNFTRNFLLVWFNYGARLLLDATRVLIISSDNPLDFNAEMWLLLAILFSKWLLPKK